MFLFVGYVDSIGKIIFCYVDGHETLEEIRSRYAALEPKPLNTQFPNRLGKKEAIEKHKARLSMEKVQLFPTGTFPFEILYVVITLSKFSFVN